MTNNKSKKVIRIATRKSPLALWQAHFVKQQLETAWPDMIIEMNGFLTEGDKLLATPLAKIGGKGLFVKELEQALLERRADIAVHSIKDMPVELLDDLVLAAICKRENPHDAFISNRYENLLCMPAGSIIGTSSARRCSQIKAIRPDLMVENLRGNVGTRLQKLDDEKYDAIVLSAAGLERLGLTHRIRSIFPIEQILPAVGQAAIGIECYVNNNDVLEWVSVLDDKPTRLCITAERSMNFYLNGGCQLPIAGYATLTEAGSLRLQGLVSALDGSTMIKSEMVSDAYEAENIGKKVAENLLQKGARSLIS